MHLVASVLTYGTGDVTEVVHTDDGTNTITVGSNVNINWMRVAPYSTPGTYTSQIFNAGTQVTWNTVTVVGTTTPIDGVVIGADGYQPAGTNLTMYVRMGNTPTPDSTWTSFLPYADFAGATIGTYSQYLQFEAVLSTSNPDQTPDLSGVSITYLPGTSTLPPTVVSETPIASGTAASFGAPVSVEFSDLMNQASITTSTFYLTAAGSTTAVPATVSWGGGSNFILQPTGMLLANTTYTATVLASVTDAAGTALRQKFHLDVYHAVLQHVCRHDRS